MGRLLERVNCRQQIDRFSGSGPPCPIPSRQDLLRVQNPLGVEACLEESHQLQGSAVLLGEKPPLAEPDAVLARGGSAEAEGCLYDFGVGTVNRGPNRGVADGPEYEPME